MIVMNLSIDKWERRLKSAVCFIDCTGKNLKKQMATRFLSIVKWPIMNTSETTKQYIQSNSHDYWCYFIKTELRIDFYWEFID